MADPTGEADKGALRLDFDRRLLLQFHGGAVVADWPAREADQDLREGRQPRTLRHVSDGRSHDTATDVCRHSVADHSASRAACTGMTGGVISRQVASGDRRGLCRCTQTSAMQPSGALARRPRPRFCSRRIAVAQGAQRRNHRRKTAGIRRMSVNENVTQQRWAAQRLGGSDGDTRLAGGYIIYDGWRNRARRGADSTLVVAPTGATSGSGPRQDAAGTLPVSVHDRSWLSSCRAKSAGSVSRSESRTTEQGPIGQLNFKI